MNRMSILARGAMLFAVIAVLAGCGEIPTKSDPAVLAASGAAYAELVTRQDAALVSRLPPQARATATPEMLHALRSFVPEGQAGEGKLVGWHFNVTTGGSFQDAVVLYTYPDGKAVLMSAQFQRAQKTEPWQMIAFNLMPAGPEYAKAPDYGTLPAPPAKTAPADS